MNTLKLMEYSQFLRHKYLETLSKLSWEDVVKDRGASFPSLRDIYLHIVFVADAYINYALQGNPNYPGVNYNEYDSIEKMQKYLDDVESKANAYLSKVTPEELARNGKENSVTAPRSSSPLRTCCWISFRRRPITGENCWRSCGRWTWRRRTWDTSSFCGRKTANKCIGQGAVVLACSDGKWQGAAVRATLWRQPQRSDLDRRLLGANRVHHLFYSPERVVQYR